MATGMIRAEASGGPVADSRVIVKALHDIDPGFVSLCETLFGDAVSAHDAWEYLYGADGVSR